MRKKPEVSLRARALQHLARREYSRAELRTKLLPHLAEDADPSALDTLLNDFVARGWLSDERAAAQLVHAKRQRYGTQRIAHELKQKGISDHLIVEALPQLKETELDAARTVWQKKFGTLPQDQKEKAKQARFLQSRGFSLDTIIRLLRATREE